MAKELLNYKKEIIENSKLIIESQTELEKSWQDPLEEGQTMIDLFYDILDKIGFRENDWECSMELDCTDNYYSDLVEYFTKDLNTFEFKLFYK